MVEVELKHTNEIKAIDIEGWVVSPIIHEGLLHLDRNIHFNIGSNT